MTTFFVTWFFISVLTALVVGRCIGANSERDETPEP
jgi:hypothetical protein